MPIKKAAFKALRQSKKREDKNKRVKQNLSYWRRQFNKAIMANDLKEAKKDYLILQKALDKSAGKKIIKKNKAARQKSRLSKKIKSLSK